MADEQVAGAPEADDELAEYGTGGGWYEIDGVKYHGREAALAALPGEDVESWDDEVDGEDDQAGDVEFESFVDESGDDDEEESKVVDFKSLSTDETDELVLGPDAHPGLAAQVLGETGAKSDNEATDLSDAELAERVVNVDEDVEYEENPPEEWGPTAPFDESSVRPDDTHAAEVKASNEYNEQVVQPNKTFNEDGDPVLEVEDEEK